jgi:hypothetical protein
LVGDYFQSVSGGFLTTNHWFIAFVNFVISPHATQAAFYTTLTQAEFYAISFVVHSLPSFKMSAILA